MCLYVCKYVCVCMCVCYFMLELQLSTRNDSVLCFIEHLQGVEQ